MSWLTVMSLIFEFILILYGINVLMSFFFFFFFNDTATTEIYTLSLHDALPISGWRQQIFINESNLTRRLSPMREIGSQAGPTENQDMHPDTGCGTAPHAQGPPSGPGRCNFQSSMSLI